MRSADGKDAARAKHKTEFGDQSRFKPPRPASMPLSAFSYKVKL
jgi:hypothetical protein